MNADESVQFLTEELGASIRKSIVGGDNERI